jgi:hypothetical protein
MQRTALSRSLCAGLFLVVVAGTTSGAVAGPPPASDSRTRSDPTDAAIPAGNAFADGLINLNGLTADKLTFPPGNMTAPALVVAESGASGRYGYDFSPDGSTLYGVDDGFSSLVTVNQTTGAATTVGPMTKASVDDDWVDLIIDPVTGAAYAASTSTGSYTLYSVDLGTGATTVINTIATTSFPIDLAMNCAGKLYAETVNDDKLYAVNPASAVLTAIGPIGVDLGFHQGMDFDNATGVLHAWLFTQAKTSQYSAINVATGTATAFPGTSPQGEFEGAIKTRCQPPTATVTSGPSGHTADRRPAFGYATTHADSVECSLDAGVPSFSPCGPSSFQPGADLPPGSYTFRLRVTNRLLSVQTVRAFAVVDCAPLGVQVKKAAKKVKLTKAKLKAARHGGSTQAIVRAATKLEKAKQKLKAAKAALAGETACS